MKCANRVKQRLFRGYVFVQFREAMLTTMLIDFFIINCNFFPKRHNILQKFQNVSNISHTYSAKKIGFGKVSVAFMTFLLQKSWSPCLFSMAPQGTLEISTLSNNVIFITNIRNIFLSCSIKFLVQQSFLSRNICSEG